MNESINKFLKSPLFYSDEHFNFYDWSCKDSALKNRMMKMVPKLKFLIKEGIIDGDKVYAWFKNNSPMVGSTYDDIRFSTVDEDDTFVGGVCPKSGHKYEIHKCSVWYFSGKDRKLVQKHFKDWGSFKKEIKINSELKFELIQGFKGKL